MKLWKKIKSFPLIWYISIQSFFNIIYKKKKFYFIQWFRFHPIQIYKKNKNKNVYVYSNENTIIRTNDENNSQLTNMQWMLVNHLINEKVKKEMGKYYKVNTQI